VSEYHTGITNYEAHESELLVISSTFKGLKSYRKYQRNFLYIFVYFYVFLYNKVAIQQHYYNMMMLRPRMNSRLRSKIVLFYKTC
jgi:hypothetical protein